MLDTGPKATEESADKGESNQNARRFKMNRKSGFRSLLWVSLLLGCGALVLAQDPGAQNPPSSDNTKMNQRDRDANEPTADKQQNARSDRDITQQIRQAIVGDKDLSTYARNVKVITRDGQVTLKGPVRSAEEKRAVETKAEEIAGKINVVSELTVKPKD
jgi:hyperosmotically inducible protein